MDSESFRPFFSLATTIFGIWGVCNVFGEHNKSSLNASAIPQHDFSMPSAGGSGFVDAGVDFRRQFDLVMQAISDVYEAITAVASKVTKIGEEIDIRTDSMLDAINALQASLRRISSGTILLLLGNLFVFCVFALGAFVAYRAMVKGMVDLKATITSIHQQLPPPGSSPLPPATPPESQPPPQDLYVEDGDSGASGPYSTPPPTINAPKAANDEEAGISQRHYVIIPLPVESEVPRVRLPPASPAYVSGSANEEEAGTHQGHSPVFPVPVESEAFSTVPPPAPPQRPQQRVDDPPAFDLLADSKPRRRPLVTCGRCRRPGHVDTECLKPHQCERCGTYAHAEKSCRDLNTTCTSCDRTGHTPARCPRTHGDAGCNIARFWDGTLRPDEVEAAGPV
ncbi:MAG: hypothetical protein M1828_005536 [Chrysothrix sp. TS-e1954]|nr:MAG: hypothetical protein M1828_005536 [Chrysothrix sp. TS-e1954]